jgi:hypothetical protein
VGPFYALILPRGGSVAHVGNSVGDQTGHGRAVGLHGPNPWCSKALRRLRCLPPVTAGQATTFFPT